MCTCKALAARTPSRRLISWRAGESRINLANRSTAKNRTTAESCSNTLRGALLVPHLKEWHGSEEGGRGANEHTHAAPSCTRQSGVSLLDATVNVVDKAFL